MKKSGKYEAAIHDIAEFAEGRLMEVVREGSVRDVSHVMSHCIEAAQGAREFGVELPEGLKKLGEAAMERLEYFAELADAAAEGGEKELTTEDALTEALKVLGL